MQGSTCFHPNAELLNSQTFEPDTPYTSPYSFSSRSYRRDPFDDGYYGFLTAATIKDSFIARVTVMMATYGDDIAPDEDLIELLLEMLDFSDKIIRDTCHARSFVLGCDIFP